MTKKNEQNPSDVVLFRPIQTLFKTKSTLCFTYTINILTLLKLAGGASKFGGTGEMNFGQA